MPRPDWSVLPRLAEWLLYYFCVGALIGGAVYATGRLLALIGMEVPWQSSVLKEAVGLLGVGGSLLVIVVHTIHDFRILLGNDGTR